MNRRSFGKLAFLSTIGTWINGKGAARANAERISGKPTTKFLANVQYVDRMPPARHPQLVYWFWLPNTLTDAQYLCDVESMAKNSSFTMAIATSREPLGPGGARLDFYDFERIHEPFAQTVRAAHQNNLKIGLQVWEFGASTRANDPLMKALPNLAIEHSLALVTEGEVILDAHGQAAHSVTSTEGRSRQAFHSEVLRIFAIQKTDEGVYAEKSLTDVTDSARTITAEGGSISLEIDATANFAGYTAYIMAAHYYDFPDLFNDVMTNWFHEFLNHYADIPFDGTALDEFGYMMLEPKREHPFRGRFYGHAFADEYKRRTGTSLERALFDMRFAPEGKPEVRARAINHYFDVMRDGPLRVEQAFYQMSKEIFGPKCFAGIHNTYHNTFHTDDLWRVGFNWWSVPREYGQSDENWPMPKRMGLIMAHREPVTFDQVYGGDLDMFLQKAFREARFGGRTHYLAWNDLRNGRINMAEAVERGKYAPIEAVEQKIRLLNQFDPAAPKLSVLMVFGMPALINWFPNESDRSDWDINGKLGLDEKAQAIWDAGYPCALLPSDFIDNGMITVDSTECPVINGHRFDCMVYLYPQYAKETTLHFLERFTQQGGRLMLEGDATHGFNGEDIAARFQAMAQRATVRGFDLQRLDSLGAKVNTLPNGAWMEDGAVVFTDYESWQSNHAKPLAVTIGGHEFSGSYIGVCALKIDPAGEVERFACGGFRELRRNGQVILSHDNPADLFITRAANGEYKAIVVDSAGTRLAGSPVL
jgi:hypothetical protein